MVPNGRENDTREDISQRLNQAIWQLKDEFGIDVQIEDLLWSGGENESWRSLLRISNAMFELVRTYVVRYNDRPQAKRRMQALVEELRTDTQICLIHSDRISLHVIVPDEGKIIDIQATDEYKRRTAARKGPSE